MSVAPETQETTGVRCYSCQRLMVNGVVVLGRPWDESPGLEFVTCDECLRQLDAPAEEG